MKVAVSAESDSLEQQVNPVFGRCTGYIIVEIEGKELKSHKFVPNAAAQTAMGAGIAAAQAVVQQGVQAVVSGNVGPNALMVLQQSGVKFYQAIGLTVEDALKRLAEGRLQEFSQPTAPGHFGIGAGRDVGMGRGFGRGQGGGSGRGMGRGTGRGQGKGTGP